MQIAILGATSQIAKDLILSVARNAQHKLYLYARRPNAVLEWLESVDQKIDGEIFDLTEFNSDKNFDAILNFVGVGNPAQTALMGATIFDVTLKYDQLAMDYLSDHPNCKYIFLSSGAAYGANFNEPVNQQSTAIVAINNLQPQDWYAVAKLYAECKHRAHPSLAIVDIRVFNYFSITQDLEARFLICDIIRAIRQKTVLKTSSDFIVRDYLHPDDFFQLIELMLNAPPVNTVVDCYSMEPVSKIDLLNAMRDQFGLRFEVIENQSTTINATGNKPYYYSKNKSASNFGYAPSKTSLVGVIETIQHILSERS